MMKWPGASVVAVLAALAGSGCDRQKGGQPVADQDQWTNLRIVQSPVAYLEWIKGQLNAGIAAKESLRKSIGARAAELSAKRDALFKEVVDADDRQTLQKLYDQTAQQAQATIAKLGEDLARHQRYRQRLLVQIEQVRLTPEMPDLWQVVVPAGLEVDRIKQDLAALRLEAQESGAAVDAAATAAGGATVAGAVGTVVPAEGGTTTSAQRATRFERMTDARQAMESGDRSLMHQQLEEAWGAYSQAVRVAPNLPAARDGLRQTAEAMYQRGLKYEFGHGYSKDSAKAAYWYRQAAEGGNMLGQHKMGVISQNSQPPDGAAAARWYEKAAQQGLAKAQNNLGSMLCEGRLVRRDTQQGMAWLRKAAQQGDRNAQWNLQSMGQR